MAAEDDAQKKDGANADPEADPNAGGAAGAEGGTKEEEGKKGTGKRKSSLGRIFSGRKSKSENPHPDACPDPKGDAPICEDPNARPPKKEKKRKCGKRKIRECDCATQVQFQTVSKPKSESQSQAQPQHQEELMPRTESSAPDSSVDPNILLMVSLKMQELLKKKRDGQELTIEELQWFAEQVALDRIEECQIGAMLMAMCIRGLSPQETSNLTKGIVHSGEALVWDESWLPVDKHTTGGVGDKTAVILPPALVCFNMKVPMVCGRGIGPTGGTLDKLESIPGFEPLTTREEMEKNLSTCGCFITAAPDNIAPADTILYAIRDVAGTADCIPLIASSVVSKKVAAGTKILVMDIKVGSAAYFKTVEDAKVLAQEIIRVSKELGVNTKVVLTKMEHPIGKGIGNSLEIQDAVECLRGHDFKQMSELFSVTGGLLLVEKGIVDNLEDGKKEMLGTFKEGKALIRFRTMLVSQGVDGNKATNLCKGLYSQVLPTVPHKQITPIRAPKKGTITKINALEIGTAVWKLGAGRSNNDQNIDHRVGIWLTYIVGDYIDRGGVWAEVHHATPELDPEIRKQVEGAITIHSGRVNVDTTLVIQIL